MKQPSRFPNGLADERSTLAKTDDYTITVADVKKYGAVSINGNSKTLTLPTAATTMKGLFLAILNLSSDAACKVFITAGFNAGGGSYDYITLPALGSALLYCNGSVWSVFGNMDPAGS